VADRFADPGAKKRRLDSHSLWRGFM